MVLAFEIVGLGKVLQTIPLLNTGAPPSEVIPPPLLAEIFEIESIGLIVTEGITGVKVVKLTSFP